MGQGRDLQVFIKLAHRGIFPALKLGNNDIFFRFQLGRVERGAKGHVLDHANARAPVLCRHIRNIPCAVETGRGIEIAAKGLDILRHLPPGTVFRALEDHVLEKVADAGLLWVFIGRTRAHIKTRAGQREPGILEDVNQQAVGQPCQDFLAVRFCRQCRNNIPDCVAGPGIFGPGRVRQANGKGQHQGGDFAHKSSRKNSI